ncbi:hypothetical protein JVT61DRAFT_8069 [Boletus reticuloceps]|uniref:Uncharacterized protein n=1 Tax=Boletus reticuloceps TaxID=495285 RepID=A0A8I2YHR1_9AGAM|nr:hypothetical protein JVT61DRAFT_8069 [Boletus reticuloceps]
MSFCLICLLRRSHCSQQANPAQGHASHSNLTAELEDSRKFSLAALTALLAVLAISGSKALQPVVLTLLMYTITLRVALNTCFLQDYPTVSRLFHVIPLLGISCMACIELIFRMQPFAFFWLSCHRSLWSFTTEHSALKCPQRYYLYGWSMYRLQLSQTPLITRLRRVGLRAIETIQKQHA